MKRFLLPFFAVILVAGLTTATGYHVLWGEETPAETTIGKDMQILKFTNKNDLTTFMRNLNISLGVTCKFCHDLKRGFDITDESLHKDEARDMMRMAAEINEKYFKDKPTSQMTCYSCHRGREKPVFSHEEWLQIQKTEQETANPKE